MFRDKIQILLNFCSPAAVPTEWKVQLQLWIWTSSWRWWWRWPTWWRWGRRCTWGWAWSVCPACRGRDTWQLDCHTSWICQTERSLSNRYWWCLAPGSKPHRGKTKLNIQVRISASKCWIYLLVRNIHCYDGEYCESMRCISEQYLLWLNIPFLQDSPCHLLEWPIVLHLFLNDSKVSRYLSRLFQHSCNTKWSY